MSIMTEPYYKYAQNQSLHANAPFFPCHGFIKEITKSFKSQIETTLYCFWYTN